MTIKPTRPAALPRVTACYAFLLTLTGAATAHAQTAAGPAPQIIVTGSRAPVTAAQMTDAFSVVPFLDRLPVANASDLLRFTPGLSVSHQGPVGSFTQVRIRGSEANQTLVFIDGVEANDPAAGEYDFAGLSAAGAQRIEVLRGPQSALWGTEAIGGVISLTTAVPDGAYVQADGGTQGSYAGAAGAGWRDGDTALAGHISYAHTDGVSVARQGREKDGFSGFNAVVIGRTAPTEISEVGGSLRFQANRVAFDDFVGGTVFPLADANLETRAQRLYGRVFGKVRLLDDRWTHEVSARFVDTRNRNTTDRAVDSTTFGSRLIFGYQTVGTLTTGPATHTLVGALEYRRETFRNVTPGASPFFDPNQRQSRRQVSLIGEYRLAVGGLIAAASVRRDDNSGFANATTWRASARYALGTDFAVRAGVGTAITNPTFYEQFGFAPASFKGNPAVTPERGTGFDIGLDGALGPVAVKLGYFNARLRNEIISVFNPDFTSSVANAANTSRRSGVEAEATSTFGAVELAASYTYSRASEPVSRTSAVQVKELRRPEHSGSLAASWRSAASRLTLTGALAYQGRNRDVAFDANFARVPVVLPGYVSASANAQFAVTPRLDLTAQIENAFDVRAVDVFDYNTPGLSVRAGLKFRFGP